MTGLSLAQLVQQVRGAAPELSIELVRGEQQQVHQFAPLLTAGLGDIAFLANPKYAKELKSTQASAVVLNEAAWAAEQLNIATAAVVVCNNPYAFFAFASQALQASACALHPATIHLTASIDPSAKLGKHVSIDAFVSIAAGVTIEDGCSIGANTSIAQGAFVGANSTLYANVTLYHGVQLGKRCIVHSGTVIGSDGFGFAPYQKRWIKIPQTGTVLIGDDVEIGSNCSIDRGALGTTTIGRGTKLDNLIQIAHNVQVGEDCAFAANIAIAGSAIVGNRVQMGGKAGVLGHLSVCDDVVISSCTLATKTISKPGFYSGVYPIQENAEWEKNAVALKRLNALRLQVRELEHAIKTIKIDA